MSKSSNNSGSTGESILALVGTVVKVVSKAKSDENAKEMQNTAIQANYKLAANNSYLEKIRILQLGNLSNDKTFRWLIILLGGVFLLLYLLVSK